MDGVALGSGSLANAIYANTNLATPASITIATGQKSATFVVATKAVAIATIVKLSATASQITATANLTVTH